MSGIGVNCCVLRKFDLGSSTCSNGNVIDTTLAHYKVLRKLGSGGMGEVYLAQDTVLDRAVALKILPRSVASDRDAMQRLFEEAKAASALNHPNVATIHEFHETDELH